MNKHDKAMYDKGRRSVKLDPSNHPDAERERFRREAFLAVLPTVATGRHSIGEKDIRTVDERVGLAWHFAGEAVKRSGL